MKLFPQADAQPSERTSACSKTVCVAFSCLVRRVAVPAQDGRTRRRRLARTFSRNVQSMVTLLRTVSTSWRAISRSVSSPSTCTALSLVPARRRRRVHPPRVPVVRARIGLTHILRKFDQFLDDLRRLYRAVLVAPEGLLQHFGE